MRIQRKCQICKTSFIAIKTTQLFCQRRCFKRGYYLRTKERLDREAAHPSYPQKMCSFCHKVSTLTFDPIKNEKGFNEWSCPFCYVTNRIIWENQDNVSSHQRVTTLLMFLQSRQTETVTPGGRSFFITRTGQMYTTIF